jgi:hypothetical protein
VDLCGGPVVLWVCGGYEFCVMVVAPWVSDLLLVVVGCWRGVWVAGMGCGHVGCRHVWLGGSVGKKNGCGRVGCRHMWLGKCGKKKL